jgi:hypothetical protein
MIATLATSQNPFKKTLYRRKGKHQVFFNSSAISFYFTALGPKGN